MSKHDEYIQEMADRLIEQIKNNEAPWQKPWAAGDLSAFMPVNGEGKPYNGTNLINLISQMAVKGYQDNRWFTFNKARDAGGKVRKGEKATTIHYWKWHTEVFRRDERGEKVLDKNGNPIKDKIKVDNPRVFYAKVFNAEQIDNLPERKLTDVKVLEEWQRHTRCDNIIKGTGIEIRHLPSDRAYYSPSLDHVVMPNRGQFESADLYYATLLHEIGHASGHESRLGRDLTGSFGSVSYAKEELRAEIASMLIGQELQIGHDPSQHYAYLEHWAKVINDDPKEIFRAVKDADAINKYIMSFDIDQHRQLESNPKALKQIESDHTSLKIENDDYSTAKESWENINSFSKEKSLVAVIDYLDDGHDREYLIEYYYEDEKTLITTHMMQGDGKAVTSFDGERIQGTSYTNDDEWQQESLQKAFSKELEYRIEKVQAKIDELSISEDGKAPQRVYLFVPFEQKDEAKALGAKWDKTNSQWFVGDDADLTKFSKWLTDSPAMGIQVSPEEEFTRFLEAHGVEVKPGHPRLDGRFHRLHIQGDKPGSLNASYVVHTDNGIPRGFYKNFKTGEEVKWVSEQRTNDNTYTSPKIDFEQVKAEAAARKNKEYDSAAEIASTIYQLAPPADPSHGYLAKKQITANNIVKSVPSNDLLPENIKNSVIIGKDWRESKSLREDPNNDKIVLTQGDLLIPGVNKDGDIRTFQTIAENGYKSYLKGGEKSGSFAVIGEIKNSEPFLIAEGYATAATLHENTKKPVVAAFDKSNLHSVAQTMRGLYPENRIYLAADNDHEQAAKYIREGRTGAGGELNPGLESAQKAAKEVYAYVLVPQFEKNEVGSDWNDIYTQKGVDELKSQLRQQVILSRESEKQTPLNITKKNFSDPELTSVQDKIVNLAMLDTQGALNKYASMENTFDGRYIASDMMKEVFDDFNKSPAHRNKYNNVVHNAAASLAAEQFKRVVSVPPENGKDKVVFLTGSPGAGKTTSVMNNGKFESNVAAIFEGQLANGSHPATQAKFQQALDGGYKIEIVAVNPKPEQALENTFKRFYDERDGRGAPIATMARIQGNTFDGLTALHEKFGNQIELTIVDKKGGNADLTKYNGWQHLNVLKSQGTETQIKQRLEQHLVQAYSKGEINYDCFKQSAGTEERARQLSAGLDRQLAGTSHQNERGRRIPQDGIGQSNKLGQRHTSGNGSENTHSSITRARDRVNNSDKLSQNDKASLNLMINKIESNFSGHPDVQSSKVEELKMIIPKIEDGTIQIPKPPGKTISKNNPER